MTDVKNSFPVHLANYALLHDLHHEREFQWWIKPTLKHKECFLKSMRARYSKRTHKFGTRAPTSVEETLQIDKDTNTNFWRNAIQKEMTNNKVAFQFLDEDQEIPIGYKWIKCHLIFDVKMDLMQKARFVAGGHMINPPQEITYSSVVMRDSV
jgi:hypothetical protein